MKRTILLLGILTSFILLSTIAIAPGPLTVYGVVYDQNDNQISPDRVLGENIRNKQTIEATVWKAEEGYQFQLGNIDWRIGDIIKITTTNGTRTTVDEIIIPEEGRVIKKDIYFNKPEENKNIAGFEAISLLLGIGMVILILKKGRKNES